MRSQLPNLTHQPEHFTQYSIQKMQMRSAVDALTEHFRCTPVELERHLQQYTFGVEIDGDIYVRSVATINHDGSIQFFSDMSFLENNSTLSKQQTLSLHSKMITKSSSKENQICLLQ